jgi:hypothetical protein
MERNNNNNNFQISSSYDLNYNPLNQVLYSNNTKLRNINYNLYQQLLKNEEEIKKFTQQINQIEHQNRLKINNKKNLNNNYDYYLNDNYYNPEKIYKKKKINPSFLNSIPIQKCNSKIECSICSDYIQINSNIIKLKCNHIFHEFCIKSWLLENYICPMCRNEDIL